MPQDFGHRGESGHRTWPSDGAIMVHPSKSYVEKIIQDAGGKDRYVAKALLRKSDNTTFYTVVENPDPGKVTYWKTRAGGGDPKRMRYRLAGNPQSFKYWEHEGVLYTHHWHRPEDEA